MVDVIPFPSPAILHEPHSTERQSLFEHFRAKITPNAALDRTLVSFQGNKTTPIYGWFKYREGFSQGLVSYLLRHVTPTPGHLLDPFAGAGVALFSAQELGWATQGIELLPIGIFVMQARLAAQRVALELFEDGVARVLAEQDFACYYDEEYAFHHIAITRGAFPASEERALAGYRAYCHTYMTDNDVRRLLLFAAACILEDISYTRKDGQYLRWDERSGRAQGKHPFNKGYIPSFREAISAKLRQMRQDLLHLRYKPRLFEDPELPAAAQLPLHILPGSCLEILPALASDSIDCVLTSPPYANRYDYTRTYALELVYLGCNASDIKQLRQAMLSCTVENKDKRVSMLEIYQRMNRRDCFERVEQVIAAQAALQETLTVLEGYRIAGKLNNPNVVRMLKNYFSEMAFVIYELARVLRPGGTILMVNDNVRYAGEEIPVDLILSSFAESFGLNVQHVWTLGRGKGNSSQQMGNHGRSELRKCVYVWRKDP